MARSPFLFNTHDLPRRAGEMREYNLHITNHGGLGFDVLAISKDEPIDIDLKIESVSEGVLASAHIESVAVGECGRCLDKLEFDIAEDFQELYEYEKDRRHKEKNKVKKSEDEEDDELEVRQMDGDEIDLDGPIRDAIILNLPLNPLCKPDCKGLCPECGEKIENLPLDHAHEKIDARWAALGDLAERLSNENKREN
jgi:uncharacterized protein